MNKILIKKHAMHAQGEFERSERKNKIQTYIDRYGWDTGIFKKKHSEIEIN